MSRIAVAGTGAVSPAGWGVPALRAALARGNALPPSLVPRPGWTHPLRIREVPLPSPRPAFFSHPRLRRAGALSQYACAAGMEALQNATAKGTPAPQRLGLIVCLLAGPVRYTHQFFEEAMVSPATASPLLFPETVFNAPASHLGALLGQEPLSYTLVGGPGTLVQALATAADWLIDGCVDGCLVIGAEETNWVLGDVLSHFDGQAILAGGAGALYLTLLGAPRAAAELSLITDVQPFSSWLSRRAAALAVRRSLPQGAADELLCDSRQHRPTLDAAEEQAWLDWPGSRLSPKVILGEGLMAAGAWQCVAACELLAEGRFQAANVSILGPTQQAIGARFSRV
jgi:hypothetical protein